MTSERWRKAESIFANASVMQEDERTSYLANACADDDELRILVDMMLDGETPEGAVDEDLDDVDDELRPGARLGVYRITGVLGRGGMGTVYSAVPDDAADNREVAIRVLRHAALEGPYATERFRRERRILASLDHHSIARLRDGGERPQPYVVMELVRGKPITEHCGGLSVEDRLRVFVEVCDAVQFGHANLMVHRDLKPANILVDGGRVKLLDFGIAKLLHAEDGTLASHRLPAPEYPSPEQLRGGAVTTATDVYALGAVLYELLAGQRAQGEGEARKPSQVAAERDRGAIEGDLDSIVSMAMRKDPALRYRSAEALASDVRRHLDGHPVAARPDDPIYRAGKYARRHRAGMLAAAALVASLGVAFTLARQQARIAKESFRETRQLAMRFPFEFEDSISNTPGATKSRELVVSTALDYLESLRSRAVGDLEVLREVAVAYSKVAELQDGLGQPSLGKGKSALDTYRKSADLWRQVLDAQPKDAVALESLADMRFREGDILAKSGAMDLAAQAHEEGFRSAQLAAALDPKRSQPVYFMALGWSRRAEEYRSANRPKEALEASEKAIEAYRLVVELEATDRNRTGLAVALDRAGLALLDLNDPAAATKFFKQGTEIRQDLLARNPNSVTYRRGFAVHLINTASALCSPHAISLGDCKQAGEQLRRAADEFEPLIVRDPNDPNTLGDSLLALANLCVAMAEAKSPGAASTCRQGVQRAAKVRGIRDRTDYGLWHGMAFAGLARAEMNEWHPVASQAAAQAAVAILRDRKFDPGQVRVALIRAETVLGEAFLAQGRRIQAREAFHRAKDAMGRNTELAVLRAGATPLRRLAEMGTDIEDRCEWLRREVEVWEQWRSGGGPASQVPKLPGVCKELPNK